MAKVEKKGEDPIVKEVALLSDKIKKLETEFSLLKSSVNDLRVEERVIAGRVTVLKSVVKEFEQQVNDLRLSSFWNKLKFAMGK